MMLIYKITEVKFFVSLREHHDVTFAENDTAAVVSDVFIFVLYYFMCRYTCT